LIPLPEQNISVFRSLNQTKQIHLDSTNIVRRCRTIYCRKGKKIANHIVLYERIVLFH
jgi:hypothetical protein